MERAPNRNAAPLLSEIVQAISRLSCVREIASFGSFAIGQADEWSDIDLLVACAEPAKTAWRAAGAIRFLKPVAFYRMFTGVAQPSGRYWFCDETPFHRLDIAFHSTTDYANALRNGVRAGHPIQPRREYLAESMPDAIADSTIYPSTEPVQITDRETEVGRLLYLHLEALKFSMRKRPWKQNPFKTRAQLLAAMESPLEAGGGDLRAFVARVDQLTGSQ